MGQRSAEDSRGELDARAREDEGAIRCFNANAIVAARKAREAAEAEG
jgi:hypothetical protein